MKSMMAIVAGSILGTILTVLVCRSGGCDAEETVTRVLPEDVSITADESLVPVQVVDSGSSDADDDVVSADHD